MFCFYVVYFFFFKQKTAYEMRISDWSSDVCYSDLVAGAHAANDRVEVRAVAIDIAAHGMDRVRDRLHVALEQAAGVGVGDHHPRGVGTKARLQRRQIDATFRSEERRVGTEGVRTCRSRWPPLH